MSSMLKKRSKNRRLSIVSSLDLALHLLLGCESRRDASPVGARPVPVSNGAA